MRTAVLLIGLFFVVVGIVGLVSPDSLMTIRQQYVSTVVIYAAVAVRLAIGLVLILFAPTSRAPKTLRALGAISCMQGLAPAFIGIDGVRALQEWEAMQTALLRAGALVALVVGGFLAFAATTPLSQESPH